MLLSFRVLSQGLLKDHAVAVFYDLTTRTPPRSSHTTSVDSTQAPATLGWRTHLPAGHWRGERAANDILALAGKGRAFRSLNTLIVRQGGEQVLYGSALALAAATQTWAADADTPVAEIAQVGATTAEYRPHISPALRR